MGYICGRKHCERRMIFVCFSKFQHRKAERKYTHHASDVFTRLSLLFFFILRRSFELLGERHRKQEPKKHSKYFFLPLLPSSSRLPITIASFHSRKCISSDVAAILFGNVLMCLCISYMHESFQIKRKKKKKKRPKQARHSFPERLLLHVLFACACFDFVILYI